MAMVPVTLPFRIVFYLIMLPFKWADDVVNFGLRKLKMTRGDAKVYAKKVARKQVVYMRNICLMMMLLVSIFSLSLGASATVYTGVYLYLIPELTQETQIYFNYVPVGEEQQN
jgi:hypothetical protein